MGIIKPKKKLMSDGNQQMSSFYGFYDWQSPFYEVFVDVFGDV